MAIKIRLVDSSKTKKVQAFIEEASSGTFYMLVSLLKRYRSKYDPSSKSWEVPFFIFERLIEEAESSTQITYENTSYEEIVNYNNTLKTKRDLVKSTTREVFHQDWMKYPAFTGIPPNEKFQSIDITKALNRNRFAFFWEMGLGKSYAIAALIEHIYRRDGTKKVLVCTSNSGVYNLKLEILKFATSIKEEDIVLATKDNKKCFNASSNIIVTSYNTLRMIGDAYYEQKTKRKGTGVKYRNNPIPIEDWKQDKNAILILDESHNIGNVKSKQTKVVDLIGEEFYYIYEFSGTPADKLEKYYPQLKLLDNWLVHGYSYNEWLAEYAYIGGAYSEYEIQEFKFDKVQALMERFKLEYASFRESHDHIKLPENYIKKIYVQMSDAQREIYEHYVISELQRIQEREGFLSTKAVTNDWMHMSLACHHPGLIKACDSVLQSKIKKFKFERDFAKFEIVDELVETHCKEKKEKIIIWTHHPMVADELVARYNKYHPYKINGDDSLSAEEKVKVCKQFEDDPQSFILIAGISSLSESVTIVKAKAQIYVERNYTYKDYKQSMKRIHRIGQTSTVMTYVILYDNSLDIVQDMNLDNKNIITTKVLSKEFLTKDEWKKIFAMKANDNEEDYDF